LDCSGPAGTLPMIEEGNLTIIQSEWSILYTEERVGRERGEEFKVAESWSSLCTELIIIFIDSLVLWDFLMEQSIVLWNSPFTATLELSPTVVRPTLVQLPVT
jgi:hypothetical protein